MSESKNLYQRLLDITSEIGKIEKTGKNSQQGYAFIEQAKVVAELRPQLAKHGVMILPETVERTVSQVTNSKGTSFTQVLVKSRYTVVNADNPEERIALDWDAGEALDMSDKATNKATTASQKTFLMKLFNISDQDDPDKDHIVLDTTVSTPAAAPQPSNPEKLLSEAQVRLVFARLKLKGIQSKDEANSVVYDLTGKDSVAEVTMGEMADLLSGIDKMPDLSE
jgi:hypothetical protein